MKTFLIILDGIADRPCNELGKKTPLEAAYSPNMDFFAKRGKQGLAQAVKNGTVESDKAIEAILGYKKFLSRGQVLAIGSGIKLQQGDLALRTNFATINNIKEGKILDRRCNRSLTTKEARILAKTINKKVKLPCKFLFKSSIQHRGVLVLRGGFSDNITNVDPLYVGNELKYSKPLDDDEVSQFSANTLNEFIEQSYFILKNHPINIRRREKKLLPANIILARNPGTEIFDIKKIQGKWLAIVYMPLEIGIAKLVGMRIASFKYPELKGELENSVYKNLYAGLTSAINFAKNNIKKRMKKFDFFYIHFKETDIPGHDGKPKEKKKMLELLDKDFFSFLKSLAEREKIKVIITADHATPCSLKAHSSDFVPFLVYDEGKGADETKKFCEKEAKKGTLEKIYGKEIIKFII